MTPEAHSLQLLPLFLSVSLSFFSLENPFSGIMDSARLHST